MPVRTMASKAASNAKRTAKRKAPAQTRTARLSKGKEKQVVHRETFRGPNPMWKVYVEIPVQASHPFAFSNDSSCAVSAPLPKLTLKPMSKRTETTAASPPTPVRTRRVILKLTSSSPSNVVRTKPSSASTSSSFDASRRSNGIFTIDPDDLARSLDQYDEEEDPQSFETLVIPSRSPTTERKSFYVGDACNPRLHNDLKRKRSDESLTKGRAAESTLQISLGPNSSKRPKFMIRVPARRPKTIENDTSDQTRTPVSHRQKGKGKELSRVLELAQSSLSVSALGADDTANIVAEQSTVKGTAELCAMCASWKEALGSPGRLEWLAPAGPEECELCRAKASNAVDLPDVEEVGDERPELFLNLPPSLTRMEQGTSLLNGPEAMNEALLFEEARAASLDPGAPERTPSLSSTRSSISLGAADHPDMDLDLDDLELGYPESYDPSPPPSPHPQIAEFQAEFMRCIEHYQEQAAAWAAAHALAEIDSDLGYSNVEVKDKYAADSEEVVTLSNDFRMAVGLGPTAPDSFGALDSNDTDVNMAEWLSSAAVSSSASLQVQG